jgi:hypothetical protein
MNTTRWLGWFRQTGSAPWTFAVEGDSAAQVSKRLAAYLRERGVRLQSNLDRVVTRGAYPNVPARRE